MNSILPRILPVKLIPSLSNSFGVAYAGPKSSSSNGSVEA